MNPAWRLLRVLICAGALAALAAPAAAVAAATGAPVVFTGSASNLSPNSATLNGTIDPKGQATNYYFQYGTTVLYGSQTPTASAGSGATDTSASSTIGSLSPGTTYHYRLVASNASGTTNGSDHTFKTPTASAGGTPGAKPTVETGKASNASAAGATLNGTVNPNGQATNYYFQYGPTTAYGSQTPAIGAGSGVGKVNAAATIGPLNSNATYHFRIVGTSAAGSSFGKDASFKTSGGAGKGGGSSSPVPKGITLVASSASITFGQTTNLSGTVGSPRPPFVTVVLQTAPSPAGPWSNNQMTAVDKNGNYTFPQLAPTSNTYYRTSSAGGFSPAVLVLVGYQVGVRVSTRHPARGHRVRFHGHVTPGQQGVRVLIQRLVAGHWLTIRRTRLQRAVGGSSAYSIRVRIKHSGLYRVVVVADAANAGSVSRTVRIRVRRRVH